MEVDEVTDSDSPELSLGEDESTDELENVKTSKKPMENLKISIDNEPDPEPTVTFVKLETESTAEEGENGNSGPSVKLSLSSKHMKKSNYISQNKTKAYENTAVGSFEAGIDISSEDAKSRREERAKRFGVEQDQQIKSTQMDVQALHESLGVTASDLNQIGESQIRTDAIMLRGVEELNTKDIFKYFSKYPPTRLEWIDDSTCNVVYTSTNDANRTLLNMSRPIRISAVATKKTAKSRLGVVNDVTSSTESNNVADITEKEVPMISDDVDDSLDLLTDITTTTDISNSDALLTQGDTVSQTVAQRHLHMDTEEGEITSDEEDEYSVYIDEREVPPGKWRVGDSFHKARSRLFMRLATKADVKVKGAERKSEYYVKHGNPNYGGLPGLISKSKKVRFRRQQERTLEKEAKEAVAEGRTKVTYNEDDLFGDVYDEADAEGSTGARSRLSGVAKEMSVIDQSRKRGRDKIDADADITDYLEAESVINKKRKPMMKMAADEEEEKQNAIRAQSEAIVAAIDVRNHITQKQMDKHMCLQFDEELPVVKEEKSEPDLRTRLSRRNDW